MKLLKKGELKLLWPFYLENLVSSIFVFFPIFMIVYFINEGFSFFQISLLIAVLSFSRVLFEIPTGAIADIYGRKFSVLLGSLLGGIAFFLILFFQDFYSLIFIFALLGFAGTFESGARESWVADLIKKNRKNFLHDYFAKVDSLGSFGLVLSGILGAFLVKQFGTSIIWGFAGVACFSSFFLLSFAKEHFVKRKVKIKNSFKNLIRQSKVSIKYVKNHSVLFLFLIATAFLVFANEFNSFIAWIPFLQNLGFPEYALGYLWSAIGILGIFAPLISLKFLKKGKERNFILITMGLIILVLIFLIFIKSILFAILILLSQLFFIGMSRPVKKSYFHKFIKSKFRATVGSIEGMSIDLVALLAVPLAGLSVDYLGPKYTILLSALLMIPSAIIFLKIKD
jgi:DHA3 family tetracycline resistance protein-like MFS transporter